MRAFLLAAALAAPGAAAPSRPIEVVIDEKLEALGVVQLLSTSTVLPNGFKRQPVPIVEDAERSLEGLRSHPAVLANAAFDPQRFDFMKRADVLQRLSGFPELAPRHFIPDMFYEEAGGRAKLEAWLGHLRDFAADPRFKAWHARERAALEPDAAAFREAIAKTDYLGLIEDYAGMSYQGRYSIQLAAFFRMGSMVNSVLPGDDGSYEIRSLIGPEPRGGRLDFRPDRLDPTAWHELAHGLLDTLGELYEDEIKLSEGALAKLSWGCYGGWNQCVKEHVVRAVMLRLIARQRSDAAAERQLRDEGEKKWPYVRAMTERLKAYEADRARYPTLLDFYPELLAVFPREAAPAAAAEAPSGAEARDWVLTAASPFSTEGRRRRALWYLDRSLQGSGSPSLRLKRAALRVLEGQNAPAEADATAVLEARPGDVGALLVRSAARRRLGRYELAESDLAEARAACEKGAGPADACANASGRGMAGAPGAAPPPRRPKGPAVDFSFAVDPRVELLSVVLMLAEPKEFEARFPLAGPTAYARAAQAFFAPHAGHPAVASARRALDAGKAIVLTQLALTLSPSAPFSPRPGRARGLEQDETEGFAARLSDFAARSRFADFFAAHAADHAAAVARAEREAGESLLPGSAAEYLRRPFEGSYVFVAAPLLAPAAGSNGEGERPGRKLRVRGAAYDSKAEGYFNFDDFASGPAHELVHEASDPLAAARRDELELYSGLMAPGCADSWQGCAAEQLDLALTLRAWRLERGEEAYRRMLDVYTARGFAQLPALCARLEEFERDPKARLETFYPRLVAVFREALLSSVKTRAAAAAKAEDERARRPARPKGAGSLAFEVDPRFELLSIALALAEKAKPQGEGYAARAWARFSPLADHPAVALAARLAAAGRGVNLPAQLLLPASDPPELEWGQTPPAGYLQAAGGEAQAAAFVSALRDFGVKGGYADFRRSEAAAHAEMISAAALQAAEAGSPDEAAEYLGRPFEGRRLFALVPLMPRRHPRSLASVGKDSVELVELVPAAGPGWPPDFGFSAPGGAPAMSLIYAAADEVYPRAAGAAALSDLTSACADRRSPAWQDCKREHLVYAVASRLAARRRGQSEPARRAPGSLPHLPAVLAALREYEASRSSVRDLAAFKAKLDAAFEGGERSAEPDLAFDPRVELYSALLALSRSTAPAGSDYARAFLGRLAPFAGHPAVAGAAALEKRAPADALPARLLLRLSHPPELAERSPLPESLVAAAGGRAALDAWLADARDFAARSRFAEAYAAGAAERERGLARAKKEAARALSPRAVLAYLGETPPPQRFLLAPLLPAEAAGAVPLDDGSTGRLRPALPAGDGSLRFGFDDFGNSAAHDLVHAVTDGLVSEKDYGAAGPPPKGCNDERGGTWAGCVQEHLVYAVTLRVLAADLGPAAGGEALKRYEARGFPMLGAAWKALEEYEKSRRRFPTFSSFYPRLAPAFRAAAGPRKPEPRPEDPRVKRLRDDGVKAFLAGDPARARELFLEALQAAPGDIEALLDLGVACERLGRAGDALDAYDRAVARATARGSSELWELAASALSSRASLRESRGERALAAADLQKAIELVPRDWSRRPELAQRLERLRDGR